MSSALDGIGKRFGTHWREAVEELWRRRLRTLLWTLRKLQNGSPLLRKNTQRLQTLETLSVGPRQKIMLIRVDDREVLVGITAQHMTVLNPWPAASDSDAPSPETTTP